MTPEEIVNTRRYEVVSQLPDNTKLKDLGLIGSCDSMSYVGRNRAQNWNLSEQIYHGVRVLEFVLIKKDGEYYCVNGTLNLVYRKFESVLEELRQYLKYLHPREFFMINVETLLTYPKALEDYLEEKDLIFKELSLDTEISQLRGKVVCLSINGCVQFSVETLLNTSFKKFVYLYNRTVPKVNTLNEVHVQGKVGLFGNRRLKFVDKLIKRRSLLREGKIIGIYYFDFVDKFIEAKMI